MPELPEVERVRLTLSPIIGRRITRVSIRRSDVIHLSTNGENKKSNRQLACLLLSGATIKSIQRHGKQLAINTVENPKQKSSDNASGCFCVHLGMTGALTHQLASTRQANGKTIKPVGETQRPTLAAHTHVIWKLDDGSRLLFRDPRRFGGIWPFSSFADLARTRWGKLGPDATKIKPVKLHQRLTSTGRALKAVLLDQHVIAGLGNIYVDELLFKSNLHPETPANTLSETKVHHLVVNMRQILKAAIQAGGSSVRDYVDGLGKTGGFQNQHQVYGRGGKPCNGCNTELLRLVVAGRSTVFCPKCQRG